MNINFNKNFKFLMKNIKNNNIEKKVNFEYNKQYKFETGS